VSDQYEPSLTEAFKSPFAGKGDDSRTRIVVVEGPLTGATYPLEAGTTTIGRKPANTICIPIKSISKAHCSLERSDNGPTVIADAGSTNGTIVNGRRLAPDSRLQLTNGDTVAIGEVTLLYLDPSPSGAGALPDKITVNRGAATSEADRLIAGCGEALAVARQRRLSRSARR
jgi:pSer/pThr/pTyr-binding forkhead associated (FHA) protein